MDTPSNLTALFNGNIARNSSVDAVSTSMRLSILLETVLLRVMISKSLNFTFSVTVRPREPLSSQCRQTLSISGCSSATIALEFGEVAEERILGADRLADAVGADLPIVDASRDPVVVRAGLAEVGLHEFKRLIAHVEAGVKAERVHLRGGRRSDAVEFADRQGFDERRPHLRA